MQQEHGKVKRDAGGNGAYSLSGLSFLPSLPPTWASDPSPRSGSQPMGRKLLEERGGRLRPSENIEVYIKIHNSRKITVMR